MGKSCTLCNSPWVDEVDEYVTANKFKTIQALYDFMCRKYGTKFDISYHTTRRHIIHVRQELGWGVEASKLREKAIRDQIYKDIETVKVVRQGLNTLAKQLDEVERDLYDPSERKEVRDIVKTIISAVELLLKYSDKIQKEPTFSEEDFIQKMLACMKEFPMELQMKFITKWKEIKNE